MCEYHSSKKSEKIHKFNWAILFALVLGIVSGLIHHHFLHQAVQVIVEIMLNILKSLSVPMIFFSIVSTLSEMQNIKEMKILGQKVLSLVVLTTFISTTLGLLLFKVINPSLMTAVGKEKIAVNLGESYYQTLKNIVPNNILAPFLHNNIISVMLIAVVLGLAILSIPEENKKVVSKFFSGMHLAMLKIANWLLKGMPLAIWAFVHLFVDSLVREGMGRMQSLGTYLVCIFLANILQGVVVLPLILKLKGISALKLFKGSMPALTMAFFTRSSNASLPLALDCSIENLKLSKKVSHFSLPLCTTINKNCCAAFIIITVFFVGESNGLVFSAMDALVWIFIATIAAIGNAGVPMGCYFLASAFLSTLNVPMDIMALILPIYTLIDMVETAVNVWSDMSITAIADSEL